MSRKRSCNDLGASPEAKRQKTADGDDNDSVSIIEQFFSIRRGDILAWTRAHNQKMGTGAIEKCDDWYLLLKSLLGCVTQICYFGLPSFHVCDRYSVALDVVKTLAVRINAIYSTPVALTADEIHSTFMQCISIATRADIRPEHRRIIWKDVMPLLLKLCIFDVNMEFTELKRSMLQIVVREAAKNYQ